MPTLFSPKFSIQIHAINNTNHKYLYLSNSIYALFVFPFKDEGFQLCRKRKSWNKSWIYFSQSPMKGGKWRPLNSRKKTQKTWEMRTTHHKIRLDSLSLSSCVCVSMCVCNYIFPLFSSLSDNHLIKQPPHFKEDPGKQMIPCTNLWLNTCIFLFFFSLFLHNYEIVYVKNVSFRKISRP